MKAVKERLFDDVKFLTELRPFRNYRNTESLAKVVTYVKTVFEECGLEVTEQKWMADGREYTNVIGIYNGHQQSRLVVGAHYDVCGDQPGADDNASAVAGLLETARMLGTHKPDTRCAIELVAYCLEEPPYFGSQNMGSYIHAKSLSENNIDVVGMICYEMIGYFSDEPQSQQLPAGLQNLFPDTGNFIVVVGIEPYSDFNNKVYQLMLQHANIDVRVISFPPHHEYAGLSDQRNYWKFGFNSLMLNDTSFLRNMNYHTENDDIDILDFDKMNEVVTGAYHTIISLSQ
jgi:hypothetical protein